MAIKRKAEQDPSIAEYTLKKSGDVIKVGDDVEINGGKKTVWVATVNGFHVQGRKTFADITWYYKPEDAKGGRRRFHGAQEVFKSEHVDKAEVDTIIRPCTVYDFKKYKQLGKTGADEGDYFWRFKYYPSVDGSIARFEPGKVAVFCVCEMPENPDEFMVQCNQCSDWFHLDCLGINPKTLGETFTCPKCTKKTALWPSPAQRAGGVGSGPRAPVRELEKESSEGCTEVVRLPPDSSDSA